MTAGIPATTEITRQGKPIADRPAQETAIGSFQRIERGEDRPGALGLREDRPPNNEDQWGFLAHIYGEGAK